MTQANVDAGSFSNTATIAGLDPSNNPVSGSGGDFRQRPADLDRSSLTKSALPSSGVVAGDVVTYTFSGKNTGTVTLHNVTVTDPMRGSLGDQLRAGHAGDLGPQRHDQLHRHVHGHPGDVDAGSYTNTATIAGLEPERTTRCRRPPRKTVDREPGELGRADEVGDAEHGRRRR